MEVGQLKAFGEIKDSYDFHWNARLIDAQAPFSCASSLVMSKFNIRKNLQAGENIIEFTPTETGNINFSCSMGMYRGVFHVVDENDSAVPRGDSPTGEEFYGGGCGTGGGCSCGNHNPSN